MTLIGASQRYVLGENGAIEEEVRFHFRTSSSTATVLSFKNGQMKYTYMKDAHAESGGFTHVINVHYSEVLRIYGRAPVQALLELLEKYKIIEGKAGEVKVSLESRIFVSTNRGFQDHPVWIFVGPSGIGKSFIGSIIRKSGELSTYETDSRDELPDTLPYDVIILGNRSRFTIEAVRERIIGEAIIVNFL